MQALIASALIALAIGPAAIASTGGTAAPSTATTATAPRVCFPAKQWSPAPDSARPCARIVRLYEDGSLRVRVTRADGSGGWTAGVGSPQ